MRKTNLLTVLMCTAALLPFLFLFGCSAPSDFLTNIPSDFSVVVVTGGIAPGQPVVKLEIDAQGNCVYYESRAEDKGIRIFEQVETFKIPPEGVHFIYKSVRKNSFFGLSKEYINRQVLDGNFAQLTVTQNSRTHTVRTQNIKVAQFDKIMIAINALTPGMNKVIYNQISWFNTGE